MQNLKENERELVKLVNFFRKRADLLMQEGKLGPEHAQVKASCEKLVEKLHLHAEQREQIIQKRSNLAAIVKDNAHCPKCGKADMLKMTGTDKSEKGWLSNKYKCRKCNIEFAWNRPNNPWDMTLFMEDFIEKLETTIASGQLTEELKEQSQGLIKEMTGHLDKLKPVIQSVDAEYNDMMIRETEMAKMIREFKSYLLIEKIKMDSWNETMGES
jgi:hypothetical protein